MGALEILEMGIEIFREIGEISRKSVGFSNPGGDTFKLVGDIRQIFIPGN